MERPRGCRFGPQHSPRDLRLVGQPLTPGVPAAFVEVDTLESLDRVALGVGREQESGMVRA